MSEIAAQFAGHEIAFRELSAHVLSYGLARPETSTLSVTITASTHRALIVHGDIQPVIFQHGPSNRAARICWLASEKCDRYVLEKASIGMGGDAGLLAWDDAKAKRDLRYLAADYDDSLRFLDALRMIESYEGQDAVVEELRRAGASAEDVEGFGRTYSPRLRYAHAAIVRLNELLMGADE